MTGCRQTEGGKRSIALQGGGGSKTGFGEGFYGKFSPLLSFSPPYRSLTFWMDLAAPEFAIASLELTTWMFNFPASFFCSSPPASIKVFTVGDKIIT